MKRGLEAMLLFLCPLTVWAGPPLKTQVPARQQVDRTSESKRERALEQALPTFPTSPTSTADHPYRYDVLPEKLPNQVDPIYPQEALENDWQGRVLLHAWLDSHGHVVQVKVYQSSGHKVLDEAALAAVRLWRYKPALVGGIVTPSEILVPIRFIIRDPK